MAVEKKTQEEIKEISGKIDCKRESWEKQKIIGLGTKLEWLNAPEKKDDMKQCKDLLWAQKLWTTEKTLDTFLQKDIKALLQPIKEEMDKKSSDAKTYEAVQEFTKEIAQKLTEICWTNTDKVALLQVYINAINDVNGKHAVIPYNAAKYQYAEGEEKRLFVDGFLGPHTYNALRLAAFGEELPQIKKGPDTWYIKEDGTVYLPWVDGKYKPYLVDKSWYSVEWGKEKELPIDYQRLNLCLEFYEIWKEWAVSMGNSRNKLNSSRFRNEGKMIKDKITDMDTLISDYAKLMNDGTYKPENLNNLYTALFDKMYEAEDIEDVLWEWDVKKIEQIVKNFQDPKEYKAKELDILDISRRKLGDAILDSIWFEWWGNSEWVKAKLLERILERNDFSNIGQILADAKTIQLIKAGTKRTAELMKKMKEWSISDKYATEIVKEINKKYTEIQTKNTKNKEQYIALIASQAKDASDQEKLIAAWNDEAEKEGSWRVIVTDRTDYLGTAADAMVEESTNAATLLLLQGLMVEAKIRQMIDAWDAAANDKDIAMMKDIVGIGFRDISDENLDYAVEAGQTIALSVVTMGAWGIAARLALAAAKIGSTAIKATKRWTRIVAWAKKLSEGGRLARWAYKSAKVAKRWFSTAFEWAAFYEWSNLATNIVLPDRTLFENADNRRELAKTAAFVGVLKWIWTGLAKLNLGTTAKTLINTNGLKIGMPKSLLPKAIFENAWKMLVQGWILTTTSQTVEVIFGWDFHPTWEEFIQACMLSRVMDGAGKLKDVKKLEIKKTDRWIEVKPVVEKTWPEKKVKKELTAEEKAEYDSLKADKRAYLEKQAEITKKMKEIRESGSYKEKLTKDLDALRKGTKPIQEEISALEKRIANHKEELARLQDLAYKNKLWGHISEAEAKRFIEEHKQSIAELEKQIADKKGKLLDIEREFANKDIRNLRLDWLYEARHVDNINVLLKDLMIKSKPFESKAEMQESIKKSNSKLKTWLIIAGIVGGTLVAYKVVKWNESKESEVKLEEVDPAKVSNEDLVDKWVQQNVDWWIEPIVK